MPPPDQWLQPWLQEWLLAPTPRWATLLVLVLVVMAGSAATSNR